MTKRDRGVWSPAQRVRRFFALPHEMVDPEQQQRMDDCFRQVFEGIGFDFDWERTCSPPAQRR